MDKYLLSLINSNQRVFHTQDLSLLWQMSGNTLYTTIKRYCAKGVINRVYKGMYIIGKLEDIDSFLLGIKVLNRYAYISTETILENNGIINQKIPYITLISSVSRKFKIGKHSYVCRQLNDQYLFQAADIKEKDGVKYAGISRAVADLLYFNPKYYFDNQKLINWVKVNKIKKEVGYANTKTK